jgi:hypothetical protein
MHKVFSLLMGFPWADFISKTAPTYWRTGCGKDYGFGTGNGTGYYSYDLYSDFLLNFDYLENFTEDCDLALDFDDDA